MKNEKLFSPEDSRDYGLSMAMEVSGDAKIPASFEVWTPPTETQKIGNCAAQAAACILECIDHRDGLDHKDRSVGYIYFADHHEEPGMVMRDACMIVRKDGDVYRDVWEWLDTESKAKYKERKGLPESITEQAKAIKCFVRLHTEQECKLYMMKYGLPVYAAGDVYNFIDKAMSHGGHAIALCGWDDSRPRRKWRYKNSWGESMWAVDKEGKAWADWDKFREYWGFIPMSMNKYPDVDPKRWSAEAIAKATEDGILVGFEDGTFRPDEPLTREQMAAIYQRMVKKLSNPTLG